MNPEELNYLDNPEPFEVRSLEERLIEGRVIRFGERIMVRGRPESFAPGAFASIKPESVRLLRDHDQSKVVGRAIALEERADGLYGTFRVAKTALGDELLQLASEGMIDALSPGFIPGEQSQDGTHRRIRAMPEVSAVFMGAYPSSKIMAVRSQDKETQVDETTEAPEVVETRSVDLSGIETRMDALDAKLDKIESIVDAPVRTVPKGGPTGFDWFLAQMEERLLPSQHKYRTALAEKWDNFQTRAKNGEFETRELADITGGETQAGDNTPADDLSGLVVEEYIASQLVNVLDRRRPLFASFGAFPAPRSGYARIPVVTQHVKVGARTGQKEEANSRKMILKTEAFEAGWLDGALDVAIELTQMAELDVMAMIWEDLRGAYAAATEHDSTHGAVPWVEAGGLGFTYTGTPLPTDKYENFVAAVEAQVDTVEDATGEPPSLLAVTRAQWRALVAMVDANDRRLFATVNPQNADNTGVGLTARSFPLPGGITVFKVKNLTQAMLYSPSSLRAADYGPTRVEATNVAKMGRDIGIIGRTMLVNRIPGGVVVFGDDPEGS